MKLTYPESADVRHDPDQVQLRFRIVSGSLRRPGEVEWPDPPDHGSGISFTKLFTAAIDECS